MALKKHKLDVAMEEDFCLLGLVSDEKDYRLCWLINKELEVNFLKEDELKLFHKKLNAEQVFSTFVYEDEHACLNFRIIRNKAEEGYFLDALFNLDYLIHIQGELNETRIQDFLRQLNEIPEVRMCVPVNLELIRNPERLYLW